VLGHVLAQLLRQELGIEALGAREVDAIVDFPVNPRMISMDLLELRDDRAYFAPYFAAPVARGAFLRAHPSARDAIQRLAGTIDNRRAATMNHAVEMLGRTGEEVAANLLTEISAAGPARPATRRRAD
jgi:glycine betaine/choline ABC-type transport system substrate-binding protein